MNEKLKAQLVLEGSDKILTLIDDCFVLEMGVDLPRGDLQGIIEAIVLNIINKTIEITK